VGQSLVKNLVHLVYSTKDRRPWIPYDHQKDLWSYQAGIFKNMDCFTLEIGGVEDHVHSLFSLSKNYALSKVVEEVKKSSSKWMKTDGPGNGLFSWQGGYAAFSVSVSNAEAVKEYIQNQCEHHKQVTFQDELRALCRKHGVDFDERFVWS